MTTLQAKKQITESIREYDAGRISLATLDTIVNSTIDALEEAAYSAGLNEADQRDADAYYDEDDMDEYDVEFLDEEDGL